LCKGFRQIMHSVAGNTGDVFLIVQRSIPRHQVLI
jgi:hypothetical protein